MPNIRDVVNKPGFSSLSREQQIKALGKIDPDGFGLMKPSQQNKALDGVMAATASDVQELVPESTISRETEARPFDDPLNPVSLFKDLMGQKRTYTAPVETSHKQQELPQVDEPVDDDGWFMRNVKDFARNTPLALLENPSITDKTQYSSPAVGGLGGSDLGEVLFGGAYSIPRDILGGIFNAGKKAFHGDIGAGAGQIATLGLPRLLGATGKGLRNSAERNMFQVLDPVEDAIPRGQELAKSMLDEFDAGAMSRKGLVDKIKLQKEERLGQTKPIEDALSEEPVKYNSVFDKLLEFQEKQGRYPVGKNLDRSVAGEGIAKEAKNLFFDEIPAKSASLEDMIAGKMEGTPSKLFTKDTNFGDVLKAKQGWGETAKEIFNQPPAFRDPTLTPRAEASGAAWAGSRAELERIVAMFDEMNKKGKLNPDLAEMPFDKYPELNSQISDLVDIEKMSSRGVRPETFLGSLPNRVLGWLPSKIGGRVIGGEIGSRVPKSVGFNTSSAYLKDTISRILNEGGSLTPEQAAVLNAMVQEEGN